MRVTQEFGVNKYYYYQFGYDGHEGIDLNETPGISSPIYACEDGIINLKTGGAYGNRIEINSFHLGLQFTYAHLSSINVVSGQYVSKGDILGMNGNTSSVDMAIHLHFMVRELDDNNEVMNTDNGYAGSLNILYINGGLEIKNTIPVKTLNGARIDYLYYWLQKKALFKGVRCLLKRQPRSKPLRMGWYNPFTKNITIYPRALKKSYEDFQLFLNHEWGHKVYWSEFTPSEVLMWEKISRGDKDILEEIKDNWSFKYWKTKYISPLEKGESEDFAETVEDIFRSPDVIYNDNRDIKRIAVRTLMSRHGYII